MKKKLLFVQWEDSRSTGPWTTNEEGYTSASVHSVGFLLCEDKKLLTICQSYSDDSNADRITIPKGCITKRRVLKY